MKGEYGRSVPSLLDGRLVRLLDGEVAEEERAELEALLEASPEARTRLEALRAMSSHLSQILESEATPAVPRLAVPRGSAIRRRRSSGPVWWQLAAGVVLLLAVGLTVEPVRAWLTTGVQRVVELLAPQETEPTGEAPVTPDQAPESPSRVSFLPSDPVFVVTVEAGQVEGALIVESVTDGRDVTASVVAGAGEELVVLPSGLGIGNTVESTADYVLSLPSGLTRVEVRIDGALVATLSPGDSPGRWEIPLARR